jgi:hypothetical protein
VAVAVLQVGRAVEGQSCSFSSLPSLPPDDGQQPSEQAEASGG